MPNARGRKKLNGRVTMPDGRVRDCPRLILLVGPSGFVVWYLAKVTGTQLLDPYAEVLPIDELHGVVMHAAFAADRVDSDNVLVHQMGGRLSFELEALQSFGIECRR